jgi:hypothetical protein
MYWNEGRCTCKACTRVRIWYVKAHRDLAFGIVSYARGLYRSSLSHICAYSLVDNCIWGEGAWHIAAGLAHNSTLQTLKYCT